MSTRMNFHTAAPAAYRAMLSLEKYLAETQLQPLHKELIKIRASQLNGCAYCIDMHTRDARRLGETEQRIYTLQVWRDTTFFTEEEQAILALTEEMTLIQNRVSDETYNRAAQLFSEAYLAEMMMAVIIINGWNRIGVATGLMPAVGEAV